MNAIKDFCDALTLYDTGLTKIRVGHPRDGGYVVIEEACLNSDVLYTYGVADDVSFELDFVRRFPDCRNVYLYDHTIKEIPEFHPKFRFFQEGVAARWQHDPPLRPMVDHLRKTKDVHENATLKMDVEWAEWEVLAGAPCLDHFEQIIVELHIIPVEFRPERQTKYFSQFFASVYERINEELFAAYTETIQAINRTHVAVHMHANNSLLPMHYKVYGHDIAIPPLLELTFVNKRLCPKVVPFTGTLPIEGLDFPCKPYKNEIRHFYPLRREWSTL